MAGKPKETRWERGGRTEAKHRVLVEYLGAWIPILGQLSWVHDLVLIDGFAGPGRYDAGERGSPLLMMDTFEEHRNRDHFEVSAPFFFIEKDEKRVKSLRQEVIARDEPPPSDITVEIIQGDYAEKFPVVVERARKQWPNCPIFAFIDPFGADTKPELTASLLALPRCEALTFVPIGFFADFFNASDMRNTLDLVFGEDTFARGTDLGAADRRKLLVEVMEDRLRESCKWVRAIELVPTGGKGRHHHLFFGTNDKVGLARMKTAMWKLDPVGGVTFVDSTQPDQVVLFETEPNLAPLAATLKRHFGDREFTIEEASDFTLFETPFLHDSHLKLKTLRPAEQMGELEAVDPPLERRKNTYPKGIKLRFVEPVSDQSLF